MIRIEHLRKEYPNVTPLKDVSATVNDGDVVSVIGPSGTGKSTLLRCINQLEKPTSGKVWLDDVEITDPACNINEVRKRLGMVFQSFNLFGHRTVIENVMLPPIELLGATKQDAYNKAMWLLRMVGLASKALNYPDELSGGQKQRIAIARTLVMDPEVILFDEPTSALDPTMVGEVQAVTRELANTGKTLMIVAHEMSFARAICNRVFYMDEGGIYEEGDPYQVFDNPVREKTRRFVHRLNVLEIEIEDKDYDFFEMMSEIEKYGIRSELPPVQAFHLQLVFEEILQLIMATLADAKLKATIEWSGTLQQATLEFLYNGPALDATKGAYDLVSNVLKTGIS
ncbi:MAG: amino acid ABC transporter ATP-binding protein [Atopobiaceae bacterium]|nr:amino acid ABC transporter ATP-binding protein [Atopobiaceae bacterium]